MMSIYELKSKFQALLRPTVCWLVQCKMTANTITVAALLGSVIMGLMVALFPQERSVFFILPVFLLFRMALNAIDGMMAREHNMSSNLGVYLNELGDIFSDIAIYLPFAWVSGFSPLLIVIIVILSILTEVSGILSCQIGVPRRYDGPCGKSDRAFIIGLLSLLLALNIPISPYLFIIQIVLIILLSLTVINRIAQALKVKS